MKPFIVYIINIYMKSCENATEKERSAGLNDMNLLSKTKRAEFIPFVPNWHHWVGRVDKLRVM